MNTSQWIKSEISIIDIEMIHVHSNLLNITCDNQSAHGIKEVYNVNLDVW